MQKENLLKTLERLRNELVSLGPDAGPVKEHISTLVDDLQQQLQTMDEAGPRATMRARLAGLIKQFESEHPSIAGMLGQIATTLANMGI